VIFPRSSSERFARRFFEPGTWRWRSRITRMRFSVISSFTTRERSRSTIETRWEVSLNRRA
jgi:hypothetical protein